MDVCVFISDGFLGKDETFLGALFDVTTFSWHFLMGRLVVFERRPKEVVCG